MEPSPANDILHSIELAVDEIQPTEAYPINDTMDATRIINNINLIEQQVAQFQLQDRDSQAYYARCTAKAEQRIHMMKLALLGFLQAHGLKNIQTPDGTAYQRSVTLKNWPADDELLAWAENHLPDAIRIKREPDKKRLGDHIKSTGEAPDGYTEKTEIRLYIKK